MLCGTSTPSCQTEEGFCSEGIQGIAGRGCPGLGDGPQRVHRHLLHVSVSCAEARRRWRSPELWSPGKQPGRVNPSRAGSVSTSLCFLSVSLWLWCVWKRLTVGGFPTPRDISSTSHTSETALGVLTVAAETSCCSDRSPGLLSGSLCSGSGLMGNSSASFMGTFLASSLGSPPSHPPHPSRPPSSPSSPSFRSGPHSSASQIWFPHSHEAPGYTRFSGSLAPTFLPMSHLDHHGNSSVLYGQHRFYDTQKENFYLRSLPSQPPLLPSNHSLPPLPRAAPGHPLGSCSRERDSGAGGGLGKGLKESEAERGPIPGHKEKERPGSGKQDSKDRQQHGHHPPLPHPQHHAPHHAPHPHYPPHPVPLEEDGGRGAGYKEDSLSRGRPLSACLLNGKTPGGESGAAAKSALSSCGAAGGGAGQARHMVGGGGGRCSKEGVSGEMRISEHPSDCLERGQVLHHSVSYSMPPPLPVAPGGAGGGNPPGGFHCLQLHPGHAHHAPTRPSPPPPSPSAPPAPPPPPPPPPRLLLPAPPRPARQPLPPREGPARPRRPRRPQGDRPHLRAVRGPPGRQGQRALPAGQPGLQRGGRRGRGRQGAGRGEGGGRSGSGGGVPLPAPPRPPAPPLPHPSGGWQRKQQQSHQQQQQQQQAYAKADKAPDWLQHQHLQQQQQHAAARSRSADCISSADVDVYRPSLPQGAKAGHAGGPVGPLPYRDCSLSGPPPGAPPRDGKSAPQHGGAACGAGGGCAMREGGQKVARIRHQQHGRPGSEGAGPDMAPDGGGQEHAKRKPDVSPLGYGGRGQQQGAPLPPWTLQGHQIRAEEEQRKAYMESRGRREQLRTAERQAGPAPRKGPANDGERPDCGGGAGRRGAHAGGRSAAAARGHRRRRGEAEDPPCRPLDAHASHSRQGRVLPAMKGVSRSAFPLDPDGDEERKRMCSEQLGLSCLDRERELLIRDNKDRVEFARIRPSSSCHGDLTSHLMVPGGASLQSSQLGADPAAHAHPAHHHWMPRTGSPSLWMTGHSYGLSHTALHQNLPPGFSAAMPSPLQPVLPLPQDPSTQLVVLPAEPATHPTTHPLDVMEQPGLWPPVYGARGPPSHMQHPAVYSRSQFLRQQELTISTNSTISSSSSSSSSSNRQTPQGVELQHRHGHSQVQKKPEDPPMELEDLLQEPRTPKPAKAYFYTPSNKNTPSPGACTAHLSPCCRSPSLHPHPKNTPCPAPSPVAAAPHSPTLSPAPPHPSKGPELQDKRGEGQPPRDYPQSLEPDLPPGYTYPAIAMGYRSGPSPQDVRLAEPAELEAVQAEPIEPAPQPLPGITEEECEGGAGLRAIAEQQEEEQAVEAGPGGGVEGGGITSCCAQSELEREPEEELFACPSGEGVALEDTPCHITPDVELAQADAPSVTCGEEPQEGAEGQVEPALEEGEEGADLGPNCPAGVCSPETAGGVEQERETPSEGQPLPASAHAHAPPPAPPPSPPAPPPSPPSLLLSAAGAWSC
ncbi:hypothetical protein MATL_G00218950 [Megalops atlanticus]|uniref:BAH domain and coiled-coil containing 1 n=1 Tax=Megalops atlanticus TaxID=7932 RepID=A0A9D3SY53_MEGAT|nr:hypothetical protein MATL_G00218950 [Megalops atlanticus]